MPNISLIVPPELNSSWTLTVDSLHLHQRELFVHLHHRWVFWARMKLAESSRKWSSYKQHLLLHIQPLTHFGESAAGLPLPLSLFLSLAPTAL